MSWLWLPLLLVGIALLITHYQTPPEEVAARKVSTGGSRVSRRVGKTLGRNLAKHTKWTAGTRKRSISRQRKR